MATRNWVCRRGLPLEMARIGAAGRSAPVAMLTFSGKTVHRLPPIAIPGSLLVETVASGRGLRCWVRRSSLSPTQHREVADQKTILSACWHMAKISCQGVLLDGQAREQP